MRPIAMLRRLTPLLLLLCSAGLAADSTPSSTADLDKEFSRSTLQIATQDSQLHEFRVWVADNEPRRQRGLMFVKHMDDGTGMLFIYPRVQPVSMWMKNTFIPLDMLFVAPDGRVVRVAANTTPQSLDTIDSGQPVLGVVELNAGVAAKLKIRAGAQIIHPAFLPR